MKNNYFLEKAKEQERWRLKDAINLLPSENITSKQVRALLSSDFGHRYTLPVNGEYAGEFLENSYRGTRITTEIEKSAEDVACEVFGSKYACVQPLSGHIAAMIIIASTTSKGDTVCSVPVENGGYDGYAQNYLPDIFGLSAWHMPFAKKFYNVDSKKAGEMIRKKKPKLVILGASFILFPYDMRAIKDACSETDATLAYDGSHVLGLIAGGEFQKPLKEGADVLYGSTHKSFFGPQGGLIATNNKEIDSSIRKNLTWRIVDNIHWNRVAALGHTLLEMKQFGKSYAKQVVKNSQRLGKELSERGFPIMFKELGFTKSHQILMNPKKIKSKYGLSVNDLSIRLEKSNIIIDSVARLGTGEITRIGMKEKDIPELAELIINAANGKDIRKYVKLMRSRFKMIFTYR